MRRQGCWQQPPLAAAAARVCRADNLAGLGCPWMGLTGRWGVQRCCSSPHSFTLAEEKSERLRSHHSWYPTA
jgi:hypothetical protein